LRARLRLWQNLRDSRDRSSPPVDTLLHGNEKVTVGEKNLQLQLLLLDLMPFACIA
jgi:hypothetical protein